MKISELLAKHLSDKATHHNYSATYDRLFSESFREAATNILELGIEHGCSLRAWREGFPYAHIWGLEKEEGKLFQDNRITTIRCDTTERDRMIEVVAKLPMMDFICDDGSHVLSEQLFATAVLWPKLKPGGILVVEDIYKPEYLALFDCFKGVELLDLRVPGGCKDDMMAVLSKPL